MNLQEFKSCLNGFTPAQQSKLTEIVSRHTNIIILGNGGSSAVASHIAEDYTKMLGKRATTFSDSARLTCYANDYGWENAYKMYLQHFLLSESLVILISSSGKSKNVLNAADYVVDKSSLITMSGFDNDNPLKTLFADKSLMHFYVPSKDYGIVEIMHNLILHSVIKCEQ